MKTITRYYKKACNHCNATGFVYSNSGSYTNITNVCPVCNGSKTIDVTEIETDQES
jgi:DnaJ-class molecular chaperone